MTIDAIVAGAGIWGCIVCKAASGGWMQSAGAREASGCEWQYALRMRRCGTMGGKSAVVIYCGNHV